MFLSGPKGLAIYFKTYSLVKLAHYYALEILLSIATCPTGQRPRNLFYREQRQLGFGLEIVEEYFLMV